VPPAPDAQESESVRPSHLSLKEVVTMLNIMLGVLVMTPISWTVAVYAAVRWPDAKDRVAAGENLD
jgi:hypothetical protein